MSQQQRNSEKIELIPCSCTCSKNWNCNLIYKIEHIVDRRHCNTYSAFEFCNKKLFKQARFKSGLIYNSLNQSQITNMGMYSLRGHSATFDYLIFQKCYANFMQILLKDLLFYFFNTVFEKSLNHQFEILLQKKQVGQKIWESVVTDFFLKFYFPASNLNWVSRQNLICFYFLSTMQ